MTATLEAQPAPPSAPPPTRTTYPLKEPWLSKRTNQALVVLAAWIVLYFFLKGHWTFSDGQPTTAAQDKLQHFSDSVTTSRGTNWFFVYFIDPIRNVLDTYVTTVQDWIHSIGWTGPTFLATGDRAGLGGLAVRGPRAGRLLVLRRARAVLREHGHAERTRCARSCCRSSSASWSGSSRG